MPERPDFDVFVSYSQADEPWAAQFVDSLKAEGVHAWFDKANVAPGERWDEQIEQALRESKTVVVLVSPNYVNTPTAFFELGAALGDNKQIIPILTNEVDNTTVPSLLRHRRWVEEPSPKLAGKRVAEVIGHFPRKRPIKAE